MSRGIGGHHRAYRGRTDEWLTPPEIIAVDQQVVLLPPGILHAIPRNFPVPSKGVLERQLVERIAEHLLLSEEMLYSLGALGRD